MSEDRRYDPAAETDTVIAAVLADMASAGPARRHRRLPARRREDHPRGPRRR